MKIIVRAIRRQIGIRFNRAEAAWFDLKFGTFTRGKISAKGLGIQRDDHGPLTGYQAVNERHLRTVFEAFSFPSGSTFVDIGCGRGKAILIAAGYDFIKRAIGIELASALCDDARKNVERFRAKKRIKEKITIIEADAARYRFTEGENIFFANNPFDSTLLLPLIRNLCEAARLAEREVFFLYGNPSDAKTLDNHPRIRLEREFKFFGSGRNINLYSIAPDPKISP